MRTNLLHAPFPYSMITGNPHLLIPSVNIWRPQEKDQGLKGPSDLYETFAPAF